MTFYQIEEGHVIQYEYRIFNFEMYFRNELYKTEAQLYRFPNIQRSFRTVVNDRLIIN